MTTRTPGADGLREPQSSVSVSFDETTTDGTTTLQVEGVVDISTAAGLADRLCDILARGALTVIVDLGEVSFLDSTGLSALVTSQLAAIEQGSTLIVARPTGVVQSLLEITGLDQVLQVHDPAGD